MERVFNFAAYKRQETVLILLNFAVLASLFFVHISFITLLGRPTFWLLLTLAVRFAILVFELIWVQRVDERSSRFSVRIQINLSILLNISFAFLASISGGTADSHYSVLMIIPILSAAYRFGIVRTLAVTAITIILTFLEVWIFFRENPPADVSEYFQAATVSLIFLVVAIVVWLLVGNLRSEEEKLSISLDELHRVQAKLVAEEKLAVIGQLASAIAHEIRNPVTMIASSLKMAEKHLPGSPVRQEMFEIATAEAKRLELLTTDFLAFARSKEPLMKSASVRDTLGYITDLAKAKASEKEITLETISDETVQFRMDAEQMRQALLNLLMNAINATPAKGKILIGAESENGHSVLFVENEGQQITDDLVERIFEPFYTGEAKGTGLGLPIVRNIARAHGGDVYLSQNEPGRVRFEIRF